MLSPDNAQRRQRCCRLFVNRRRAMHEHVAAQPDGTGKGAGAFVGLVDRAARSLVHTPVDRFVLGGPLADCPHLLLFGPDGGTRDALATRAARLAVTRSADSSKMTHVDLLVPDSHQGQASDVAWLHDHVVPLTGQPCMAPHGRHVIVVRDADRLAQPAQALLCRALEDAGRGGTALLVLTVRSLGAVPGRLRSQCALVRCPMPAGDVNDGTDRRHMWRAAATDVRGGAAGSGAWRYADFLRDAARKMLRAKGPYAVASCVRFMASEVLRMVEPQVAVRLLLDALQGQMQGGWGDSACADIVACMADCSVALTAMTRPVHAIEAALLRVWLDRNGNGNSSHSTSSNVPGNAPGP